MLRSRLYLSLLVALPTLLLGTVDPGRAVVDAKAPFFSEVESSTASPWIPSSVFSALPTEAGPADTAAVTDAATDANTGTATPSADAAALSTGSDMAAIPDAAEAATRDLTWLDDWQRGTPAPPKSAVIPVLMYHHVAPIDYTKANALETDLTVLPTEFEKQLSYMRSQGYNPISLREVWNYFQGGSPLPPKAVVLTFDDGYNDVYSYAYPLLTRYGFRGTFFIITGLLGGPRYMTMDQVLGLFQSGMEIGAHSSSHPSLTGLSASRLTQELVPPKKNLEEVTGAPVLALAYPNGAYDQTTIAAARSAGYRIAVTTKYGAVEQRDKLMEMVRVRVHGAETIASFRAQLERYYPAHQ